MSCAKPSRPHWQACQWRQFAAKQIETRRAPQARRRGACRPRPTCKRDRRRHRRHVARSACCERVNGRCSPRRTARRSPTSRRRPRAQTSGAFVDPRILIRAETDAATPPTSATTKTKDNKVIVVPWFQFESDSSVRDAQDTFAQFPTFVRAARLSARRQSARSADRSACRRSRRQRAPRQQRTNAFERQLFARRVHSQRHVRARAQRRQQQLKRRRAFVRRAFNFHRLVGCQVVSMREHVVGESTSLNQQHRTSRNIRSCN
jgi:hypothetical protein